MSREIKFRAWTGEDMVFVHTLDIYPDSKNCRVNTVVRSHYEQWPIMQFTGLRDDKGTELFEGDVIEFDCEEMGTERGVIRFSDGGFWTSQPKGMDEQLLSDELHQLKNKKIGDVYSNPELLTP